jgi:adenylosuccinate synthase
VGTVTGRNRRCGWFDAALIKNSIQLSSVSEIALTKLDVLDQLKTIKICVAYKINDKIIDYMPNNIADWELIKPVYEEIDGWQSSTLGINSRDDLPQNAKKYISYIEKLCKVRAVIISTGANREQTILEKF